MPCSPALFLIADSVRRNCAAMALTGSPCSANSRSNRICAFDQPCAATARDRGRDRFVMNIGAIPDYFIVGMTNSAPP
jgi:hypothetical protein